MDYLLRLEATGWAVGSPKEFLGMTDAEADYVEVKAALAAALRQRRHEQHLSQTEVARRLRSSQSRVAKMEAGDPSVTVDLLLLSFLKLGGTREMVAAAIKA
jgi:predicted XRE-type DNA-binding protein